jgi:hypothetical protein
MRTRFPLLLMLAGVLALPEVALAQFDFYRGMGRGQRYRYSMDATNARDVPSDNAEGHPPRWENPIEFEADVFTFLRIRRASLRGGSGNSWATDLPDSDLNLSYRLQQMTAMRVNPDGRIIELTDPALDRYPFIYMVEPGSLYLFDEEIVALRQYLLSGGFLMFDDFWGEEAWRTVEGVMNRVFPDRQFMELSLDHPIYRSVFRITEKGQVPNVRTGTNSQYTGQTWERGWDSREVHHRVISDDKGRIMVFAAHNTDYGDGWEREGNNQYYFRNFSEKYAYPMGINVLFYAMTH